MSSEALLNALTLHNTPHYTNVHDLGFLLSPHGIPYIPLPPPHEAYCLTNYLPVRPVPRGENDAEVMCRMINTPEGQDGLGRTKIREETVSDLEAFVGRLLSSPQEGWCTGVIRLTSEVESLSYPRLLGNAVMKRWRFDILDPEDQLAWMEKEKNVPDTQAHWSLAAMVDPACGGRGLAVAALRHIIERWYVPTIHTFSGQLVSAYFSHNRRSQRMHEKLGFKAVAVSRRMAMETDKLLPKWRDRLDELDLVCCVWQGFDGEWAVEKADSVFKNLPSVEQ